MSPFDKVLAVSQVFILAAWEALGVLAFGWNPWVVAAVWFVGLWSFNVLIATAVRTFYKLVTPGASVVNNTTNVDVHAPEITEQDIG